MLARLTRIAGVLGALVDCTGSWFLVTARDAAALEGALGAVRDVLGPSTELVEGIAREQQLADRERELWFSADNIRALSLIEGRVLPVRVRDLVVADVELDEQKTALLLDAVRLETFAALNHAHDTGGRTSSGWFWKEWPEIVPRILGRLAPRIPAAERVRLEASLLAIPARINR